MGGATRGRGTNEMLEAKTFVHASTSQSHRSPISLIPMLSRMKREACNKSSSCALIEQTLLPSELTMDIAAAILSRRRFLNTLAGAAASLPLFAGVNAFAEELIKTPPQTEGPFYPDKLPLDTDNDLL